jgi:N-acetylmuramoyl-L-alanine amidase
VAIALVGVTIGSVCLHEASAQRRAGDVGLLARVVAAEAEGEPYQGMVAVAAVLLNRVESAKFPNTINGVVFQPQAFESVSNGLIWQRSPSQQAISAARDAVNGMDPTYGCLFFWNPSKPVSRWMWSRSITTRIGKHVFAR